MIISKLAVGVTGSIGAGKSEACRIFAEMGGKVLYADPMAKEIMETDPRVRKSINALFEHPVYHEDGTLNRKMLARMIFTDDHAKTKIEAIVHPKVIQAMEKEIAQLRDGAKPGLLFVESALIYEAKFQDIFDYVVVVDSNPETAESRILSREQITKDEIAQRRKSQLPGDKKAAKADFVIHNNGTLKELEERCRFIFSLLSVMTPAKPLDPNELLEEDPELDDTEELPENDDAE